MSHAGWPSPPVVDFGYIDGVKRHRSGTILLPVRVGDIDYLFYEDGRPTGVMHDWNGDGELADTAYAHWKHPIIISLRDMWREPRSAREASESEARDFSSPREALAAARSQGAKFGKQLNSETIVIHGDGQDATVYRHGGKWHVSQWFESIGKTPGAVPIKDLVYQEPPRGRNFDFADEAREDAPVVYEEAAAPRRSVTVMRWHRKGDGHYEAKGNRGIYTVKRQRPDRRNGLLPWHVIFGERTLKTRDTADLAKQTASSIDEVLSDPHLCPQSQTPSRSGYLPKGVVIRDGAESRRPKGGEAREQPVPSCGKIVRQFKRYGCNYVAGKTVIDKPEDVYTVLGKAFVEEMERSQEVFVALLLDVKRRVIDVVEIARGQKDRVGVGVDDCVAAALAARANFALYAHDHPSFDSTPSQADKDLTLDIYNAINVFSGDLECEGHFVLGKGEITWLALSESGKVLTKKYVGLKLK